MARIYPTSVILRCCCCYTFLVIISLFTLGFLQTKINDRYFKISPEPEHLDRLTEDGTLQRVVMHSTELPKVKQVGVIQPGSDLQTLVNQSASNTNKFVSAYNKTYTCANKSSDDIIKELGVSYEGDALINQVNLTYILAFSSTHKPWPPSAKDLNSLQPAFKWSRQKRQVPIVLGIPTVKRQKQSYLEQTLKSIFNHISDDEANEVLVIVMIAQPNDTRYVNNTADIMGKLFKRQLDKGLLEIIAPPANFYPDLSTLKQTFGDNPERVYWRSKQNLDYALLMMYANCLLYTSDAADE